MKNKLYLLFSILFCVATLFMGVGYASINSISLNVNGEIIAQVQEGIFITEVKYNDELSSNVVVSDSKINSSYQTNLDSGIVLNNDKDSKITYDITIYNSNALAYAFDSVEYAIGEKTYSNENIIFELTNLNEGDVVNSKDDITFSITFYYKDSSNISDVKLDSILNFKFIKTYDIFYIGFEDNNYLSYALEEKSFNLSFEDSINQIRIKSGDNYLESSEYSFDGNNLVINAVVDNITIINVDNVQIVPDFTFSNEVYTVTMGGYSVYRVNAEGAMQIVLSLNGTYDLSNMSYVEFDLYIPAGYAPINLNGVQSQLELGSAGVCDVNEITYGLDNKIYSNLVPGFWNHVVISLSDFSNDEKDGYDITKINYIGLYWNNEDSDIKYTIPNCQIKNFKFSNYIL